MWLTDNQNDTSEPLPGVVAAALPDLGCRNKPISVSACQPKHVSYIHVFYMT